jgi:hypothetical protein
MHQITENDSLHINASNHKDNWWHKGNIHQIIQNECFHIAALQSQRQMLNRKTA